MNFSSFFIYCFVVAFSPGPSNIVILAAVQNEGMKKALRYIAGASLAFFMLIAASVFLNSRLGSGMPAILSFMRIGGSLFMLYLAYQIYRMDVSNNASKQATSFTSGFLTQFLNPKVVVFTLTVIPSFVMPYYTSGPVLSVFVVIVTLIGVAAYVTWAVCGTLFQGIMQKYQKASQTILALLLVYSAITVSGITEFIKG
ncbi:Threonine/homoserine/homoserine lactone efflux protein [Paenibacillus uliginis N3/975]|uniref:Threonine/homoserine/homoserine lactone efflux protein n=1 Tax=Paenibacillus uliginis N3/975 TaxID=1313296 RepID=A0A1X7HTX2_9BACL|nr:LysE family transporter [Paenibacillus uliginis]SMF91997.1 Threonine/homoserine/homoserine lactone efflux protein [Paenibacillus uliginis N3/975]